MNTNEALRGVVTTLRRKEAATTIVFEFDLREANRTTRRVRWSTDSSAQLKEGDTVAVIGQPDANNILDARSLSIESVQPAKPVPWKLLFLPAVALVAAAILAYLAEQSDQSEGLVGTLMAAGILVLLRKKWRSGPMAVPAVVIACTSMTIGLLQVVGVDDSEELLVKLLTVATLASAAYVVFLQLHNRRQQSSRQ